MSRHLKAPVLASSLARDLGFTPIQRMMGAEESPTSPMRTMRVLVHSTPISSRQARTLGATLCSQAVLNLWWTTKLSYLSLRYTSAPLNSFHGVVLVCANKLGEEGSPATYRVGFHVRRGRQCTRGRITGRKRG